MLSAHCVLVTRVISGLTRKTASSFWGCLVRLERVDTQRITRRITCHCGQCDVRNTEMWLPAQQGTQGSATPSRKVPREHCPLPRSEAGRGLQVGREDREKPRTLRLHERPGPEAVLRLPAAPGLSGEGNVEGHTPQEPGPEAPDGCPSSGRGHLACLAGWRARSCPCVRRCEEKETARNGGDDIPPVSAASQGGLMSSDNLGSKKVGAGAPCWEDERCWRGSEGARCTHGSESLGAGAGLLPRGPARSVIFGPYLPSGLTILCWHKLCLSGKFFPPRRREQRSNRVTW